jgi:hypothetical protein
MGKRPTAAQVQTAITLASATFNSTKKSQQLLIQSNSSQIHRAVTQSDSKTLSPLLEKYITAARKFELISAIIIAFQELSTYATQLATSSAPPPAMETHITTILVVANELKDPTLLTFRNDILAQLYDSGRLELLSRKAHLNEKVSQLLFEKQITDDHRDAAIQEIGRTRGTNPEAIAKMLKKKPAGAAPASFQLNTASIIPLNRVPEFPRERWGDLMGAIVTAVGPNLQ